MRGAGHDKDTTLEELVLNHNLITSTVGYGSLDGLANRLILLPGTKIEAEYLKDKENCFQVEITEKNCLQPTLYYTQYTFRDDRVTPVYAISFLYHKKFIRIQSLFDGQLRNGTITYAKHTSLLWKLRDQFAQVFCEILSLAGNEPSNITVTPGLISQLDKIILDYCRQYGFHKDKVQHILDEEPW